MAIDPYSQCLGGTGKKVKFCCPDLLSDLDKIDRMLEAEQRQACLDHIQQLEGKYPGRACLLTTKAMLLNELQRPAEAEAVLQPLLAQQPGNPVALAERAMAIALQHGGVAAIDPLQAAMAACGGQFPSQVYHVLVAVTQFLLAERQLAAVQGHLLLTASLSPDNDQVLMVLARLQSSPDTPLLLKQFRLEACQADVAWKADFDAATELSERGAFRLAAERLMDLSSRVADAPAIWRNLAIFRMWLADDAGAASALRRLAALDVPLDDAVEAEALAQFLDPAAEEDRVDILRIEYPVRDIERLIEALSSDRRFSPLAIDTTPWREENLPPPKQCFDLLDRPLPKSVAGLAVEATPRSIAQTMLFGRETDRDARLEMIVDRRGLPRAGEMLADAAYGALGSVAAEKVIGAMPAEQVFFRLDLRLPDDTTPDQAHELLVQHRRRMLLDDWPRTASAQLGGQSPEQAAADPDRKIAVLAAILSLELRSTDAATSDIFDRLRARLGLPEAKPIDPTHSTVEAVPLARLMRIQVDRLADDDLVAAFQRAIYNGARWAAHRFATEIIGRPVLDDKIDNGMVLETLARLEDDPRKVLSYLGQARDAYRAKGKSCAAVDLYELPLRLNRGEVDEFAQLLEHVQRTHAREPGVGQSLFEFLVRIGMIGPDGRPLAPPHEAEAAEIVVPSGAAEAGKIWTPESEARQGQKSPLWVPGMD